MAYAPSQPGIVSEREFSLIADGLFNGELDERAARLAEKEREQQREFNLLTDEVERLRLFNEELDLRAERMDRRGRDLAHAMEMRAAELDRREEALWNEEAAILARGQLQRGREAELGHWQSQLEAREDELATAQAQLSEEREAFERWARRARDEVGSSPVSPPPEGDF